MSLCLLNLTIQVISIKARKQIGIVPLESVYQTRNAYIIMKRIIKYRTFVFLFMVVLFSLNTGTRLGANL